MQPVVRPVVTEAERLVGDRQGAVRSVRRQLVFATVLALGATGLAWGVLVGTGSGNVPAILVAGGVLFAQLGLVYGWRSRNRRSEGSTVLPGLGLPTGITIARGVLLAWLAGLALIPWATTTVDPRALTDPIGAVTAAPVAWLPAATYGLAAALDAVDGWLARRLDRVTELGASLDGAFDAFGIFLASLVAVLAGFLPVWYLLVGGLKYVYSASLWIRRVRGLPVFDLPDRSSRRLLAGLQMAFLALVLVPIAPGPVTIVGAILLGGAYTAGFVRDWAYATGRLATGDQGV